MPLPTTIYHSLLCLFVFTHSNQTETSDGKAVSSGNIYFNGSRMTEEELAAQSAYVMQVGIHPLNCPLINIILY